MDDSQGLGQAFIQRVLPRIPDDAREVLACAGPGSVWLRRRTLTLLSIEGPDVSDVPGRLAGRLDGEIDRLAERHGGMRDRFAPAGTVLFFADAADAMRMGVELQRMTAVLRLRVGIDTADCVVAAAQVQGEMLVTLLGEGAEQASRAAGRATSGSVFVAAPTYSLARNAVETDTHDCLLAEEFDEDSNLSQVTITPAPARGTVAASTFAGLGRF